MYNGVGLQTARGSGTSGYVQRNLSHVLPGQKAKLQDYGKILQQLKDTPEPLPKPPNQELINHEKRRKIEATLFTMAKQFRKDGSLSEEQVQARIAKERARLLDQLKSSSNSNMDLKDQHQAALVKQRQMDTLKSALRISENFEEGAAFDLELQERKREQKLAEKDLKRKEQKRLRKEAKREKQRQELQRQLLMVQQTVENDEKQEKESAASFVKEPPSRKQEPAQILKEEKKRERSSSTPLDKKGPQKKSNARRSRSRSASSSSSDKPRNRREDKRDHHRAPRNSRSQSRENEKDRGRKARKRSSSRSSSSSLSDSSSSFD